MGGEHPSLSQLTGSILHKISSEVQAELKSAGQLAHLHYIQTQFSSFLSPFINSSLVLLLYVVHFFRKVAHGGGVSPQRAIVISTISFSLCALAPSHSTAIIKTATAFQDPRTDNIY